MTIIILQFLVLGRSVVHNIIITYTTSKIDLPKKNFNLRNKKVKQYDWKNCILWGAAIFLSLMERFIHTLPVQWQGPPPPWHSPDDWMAELLSAAVLYLSSPLFPVFANNTKLCKTDEILTMCCSICTQLLPHIRWLDLRYTIEE